MKREAGNQENVAFNLFFLFFFLICLAQIEYAIQFLPIRGSSGHSPSPLSSVFNSVILIHSRNSSEIPQTIPWEWLQSNNYTINSVLNSSFTLADYGLNVNIQHIRTYTLRCTMTTCWVGIQSKQTNDRSTCTNTPGLTKQGKAISKHYHFDII